MPGKSDVRLLEMPGDSLAVRGFVSEKDSSKSTGLMGDFCRYVVTKILVTDEMESKEKAFRVFKGVAYTAAMSLLALPTLGISLYVLLQTAREFGKQQARIEMGIDGEELSLRSEMPVVELIEFNSEELSSVSNLIEFVDLDPPSPESNALPLNESAERQGSGNEDGSLAPSASQPAVQDLPRPGSLLEQLQAKSGSLQNVKEAVDHPRQRPRQQVQELAIVQQKRALRGEGSRLQPRTKMSAEELAESKRQTEEKIKQKEIEETKRILAMDPREQKKAGYSKEDIDWYKLKQKQQEAQQEAPKSASMGDLLSAVRESGGKATKDRARAIADLDKRVAEQQARWL